MTKKPIFRKISNIKSKDTRQELARAHAMVTMLSLALIVLLLAGAVDQINYDNRMASVAIALLSLVALFSFVIAYRFRR